MPVTQSTSSNLQLTQRETEVLVLLAAGLKKMEIAKELGTKPSTVEKQIVSAYKRLGCRSTCQAISKLIQLEAITL